MVFEFLAHDFVQLMIILIVLLVSIRIGDNLYRHAANVEQRVEDEVVKKQPRLTYVLYDIFWAPLIIGAVFGIVLAILHYLPASNTKYLLVPIFEALVLVTMAWFAVRVIKEVILVSETADEH